MARRKYGLRLSGFGVQAAVLGFDRQASRKIRIKTEIRDRSTHVEKSVGMRSRSERGSPKPESRSPPLPSASESSRLHRLPRNVGGRCNALHAQLEVVSVGSVLQSGFVIDQAGLEQIPQRLVESLHPVLRRTGRNGVANRAR